MLTLAAGNKRQRGFTLFELLVVVSIIGIASAGVVIALPDSKAQALDKEAVRISALIEMGRAKSRMMGVPVFLETTNGGFQFVGSNSKRIEQDESLSTVKEWLDPETRFWITDPPNTRQLLLGPEPIIGHMTFVMAIGDQQITMETDGLRAFQRPGPVEEDPL